MENHFKMYPPRLWQGVICSAGSPAISGEALNTKQLTYTGPHLPVRFSRCQNLQEE